jgi:hypothetical protein
MIHSDPVNLGEVTAAIDGSISGDIMIPQNIPAGYHTLTVSGQTYSGEQIKYEQTVLVQGSDPKDRDEDGINDTNDPCMFLTASGIDIDSDGVDDACDPVIGDSSSAPSAPTNAHTNSPTNGNPILNWTAVNGVTSYKIYRDGISLGTANDTTYTDNTSSEGTHEYYITAVTGNIESNHSNSVTVLVDRTAPDVKNLAFLGFGDVLIRGMSLNLLTPSKNSNVTISADATDIGGIAKGEYYIDTDSGKGRGVPMTYSNNKLSAIISTKNLSHGYHNLYARADDSTGNWSSTTSIMFFYP